MTMVSYAIYRIDTGEIVQLHVESAELESSPDEIIQMADPHGEQRLDVVRLPKEGLPAEAVRVVSGELRATEESAGRGAAGGASMFAQPAGERRYEFRRSHHDGAGGI